MPPKKGNSKKAATKAVASSPADAKLSNNGEKEVTEELAIDTESLANGSSKIEAEDLTKLKTTKRSSGRIKNVALELEAEAAPSKKPAAKGRGKKKLNENEVIENEIDAAKPENQEVEETTIKANEEEVATKPKGRGGGGKNAEPKAKRAAKAKANKKETASTDTVQELDDVEAETVKEPVKKTKAAGNRKKKQELVTQSEEEIEVKPETTSTDTVQEEEPNEVEEENVKEPVKKTKAVASRKKKQEVVTKPEEEIEEKPEITDEVVEKVSKKNSRNSKKLEEISSEIEPQKKKGRASKKDKSPEKDEVEVLVEQVTDLKAEIKEKKPTKRGRGAAKAVVTADEEQVVNGDAEEVLPKKRSRKAPSVEKVIVTEKSKKGRGKKTVEKVIEEDAALEGKEEEIEDEFENGQVVKEEKNEDIEEGSSITEDKQPEPVPAAAAVTKAKGGRKRAAPSANKKKSTKTDADIDQLDDGVDNTELEADEADVSKPSKTKKTKTDTAPLNATVSKYNKDDFELPPPAEGQTVEEPRFNLKISSWNVAGLRSWVKKDGLKFLEYEQPDIFCMQETKCTTEQLPEEVVRIPGYHPYWLCMPGGYAGVAIYSKIMPINVEYGIGHKEFDDCGRIITAEYEKFFLINTYVPNSGRKLVNLEARMKWEKLFQQFVQNLDARKPVVICGDMNVSHQEHDLANPKSNTRNAGFTKEERDKMSELLALGYVDTFRHLYPDRKGAYTFWTYMGNARSRNVGWRLDYFIVSERFIKRVVDNCIRSQCLGSDHCPITLFLKL